MSRILNNNRLLVLLFIAVIGLLLGSVSVTGGGEDDHEHEDTLAQEQDKHEGHDHDDVAHENDGHDHDTDDAKHPDEQTATDAHAGHDHEDELTVELSPEAVKLAGISISTVGRGRIEQCIELPGEVGFNEDRVVHIAPRFAGIALKANYRIGDHVSFGDVVAVVESNESMSAYSIKAPMSGWVISRHVTAGEFVSEENSIYVIADLSTVWVNLAVYPKDAHRIRKGQVVEIDAVGSSIRATGKIEYISPIMDLRTRSLTARVVLSNMDKVWRPGAFVQAMIATEGGDEGLVVDKGAVQFLEGQSVVFVVDGTNRFRPIDVVTGAGNARQIRILHGLKDGAKYVSGGAFELKAKIVTSNMDAHAGHSH
ncbi:MAG: efflux RND transporter periplasmic adaptor subunit [candidate division Zixibacteria bacterium]|nr:efflux RND transporter periplasmic adaptor subunit [candidate division Zixibacteria bacterium]MDH3939087.1 efflux RND transporter periplasmic adaptor subunit [candidate division Zixibacteria bacterium]MDH4034329.1 efflux RND transporter periplasmic adaptor subunit [candidate division Zixibacteria bacterium]